MTVNYLFNPKYDVLEIFEFGVTLFVSLNKMLTILWPELPIARHSFSKFWNESRDRLPQIIQTIFGVLILRKKGALLIFCLQNNLFHCILKSPSYDTRFQNFEMNLGTGFLQLRTGSWTILLEILYPLIGNISIDR